MTPENFENHILFIKLEQFNQRINDEESKKKIDLEKLIFFECFYSYVSDRMNLTIPILVQDGEMNALSNEVDTGLQQINSFLGNNNIGHLNNASNNFYSALTRVRNFPLPFAKNDFNFSKVIASFQKSVSEKYQLLESENDLLKNHIESFNSDLGKKEEEIQRLFKLIETKEKEIETLNTNFQNDFNNIKAKVNQEFETDRKTFRSEIEIDKSKFREEVEGLKENINTDTSEILYDLNVKLEEAKRIVNVIGNIGVTGNYQIIANEHKSAANLWRWIAIGFMAAFSGLLVWTIIDLSSDGFNWIKSVIRLVAAASLSYPATYAARESNKHRKLEIINRTAELELASINPFIEILSDDKKQTIKEKLVEKYFGNDKMNEERNERDNQEFLVSSFERLFKSISPLIKK